ncbi:MAG: exodeoxyribonuclease VII large subunit [Thermoleophilaceae bacterium]
MTDQSQIQAGGEAHGIPGFPGPYPVGRYAEALRERVREFASVSVIGELTGVRAGRGANVYFELRDGQGALPCAMWRDDFDRLGLRPEDFRDGVEVVAAGGCDYYPGGPHASPSFSFRVKRLRLAGEGDLLAQLAELRRRLAAEGLFEHQKRLERPALPRTIGVVTAETGAAKLDFLAGLERRAWRGRIVWGYAPVQDRHAAPAIGRALQDLAAVGGVETIVVTRGGGSIADLWAFCDETLCRTVALLPVPVITAVGHHVDRTLIDDVAAECCSTPTHAAEAAVRVDCADGRRRLEAAAARIATGGRDGVLARARALAALSRAPREHADRHRRHLHQKTRELRAASRRGVAGREEFQRRIAANVIGRKREAAAAAATAEAALLRTRSARLSAAVDALRRRRDEALRVQQRALRAHDPERTLERGYSVALDERGEPLATPAAVRQAGDFTLRMKGGELPARVRDEHQNEEER